MRSAVLRVFLVTAAVIAGLAQPVAAAQTTKSSAPAMRQYDAANEVTLNGTIEEVKQFGRTQARMGTHVILKTDKGTFDVHVGPQRFIAQKNFSFAKGDQVQVIGSRVAEGEVVAREVKKGDQTLELRDSSGKPLWSGAGRGPQSGMAAGQMGPGMNRGQMGHMGHMGHMGRMGQGMGRGMGAAAGTAPAASGKSDEAADVKTGKQVFTHSCAMCHNASSNVKKMGPGLKGLFQEAKMSNGKPPTEQNVREIIEDGAKGMPPYKSKLSKEQIEGLVAYLKTL